MVFVPPLVVVGVAFAVGATNPLVPTAIGVVAMTGMAAIVLPGPLMILGFVLAAAGSGAGLLMLRRG